MFVEQIVFTSVTIANVFLLYLFDWVGMTIWTDVFALCNLGTHSLARVKLSSFYKPYCLHNAIHNAILTSTCHSQLVIRKYY